MKRLGFVAFLGCLALFGSVTVASAGVIVPTKVPGVSSPSVDELTPSANDTMLGWAQNSIAKPKHYNAFVAPLDMSTSPTRLNAGHTEGFMGGINGAEAMFQEIVFSPPVNSDIHLYDLMSATRSDPPSGVNTSLWEWAPSSSPGFILFGRNGFSSPRAPWQVILYDRTLMTFTVLDHAKNKCQCIFPGTVTDSFSSWTDCKTGTCQVYYWNNALGVKTQVINALGKQQYADSISGDSGSIYFAQSGSGCGTHVKLMRFDIGGKGTRLVSALPLGQDIGSTFTFTDAMMHDHVYFGRLRCGGKFYSNIWVADNAETALRSVGRAGGTTGNKTLAGPDAVP